MAEKQVFRTKIDQTFFTMHFGILAVMSFFTVAAYRSSSDHSMFSFMLGLCIVVFLFTILSFLFLRIIVKDEFLIVHLFYPLYTVDIKTITMINTGKTMWFGLHKHGTARKGLIISSKFKNDVYITPQNQETFLQKLTEINPEFPIKKTS
ncbi:PH domain-containing protein [Kaistella sp.]|uniref:PH domain-containing protein n=1 Tax=Kaistella sp. TaxID=2782235 RepID=UPI0035A17A65